MVSGAPARAGRRRLQRYSLGPLIVLIVLIAVLFGIASSPSRNYAALVAGALAGLVVGAIHGATLGRGTRSVAVMALAGVSIGVLTAKLLLGEGNPSVAIAGGALILVVALGIRLLRTFVAQ